MEARTQGKKPTHRPRAPHLGPERRRPAVLDAARKLFLEHGYDGTSMEAIAGAAGVTKPVVYDCFASKDALFRSLLEREEGRILSEIGTAFGSADLNDPERTLVEGYTAFLRAIAASPDVYRLIFLQEGGGNAAIARRVQRGREGQVLALANLSRSWLSQRRDGRDDAELDRLAGLLGQALVGLAEAGARSVLSDGWSPEEAGQAFGRLAAASAAAL